MSVLVKKLSSIFGLSYLNSDLSFFSQPIYKFSKLPYAFFQFTINQFCNAFTVSVSLFPLSFIICPIFVSHLPKSVDFILPPLTIVNRSIYEVLTSFTMSFMLIPFADVIRAIWLYLASKSVHFVAFPLALIQEAKSI